MVSSTVAIKLKAAQLLVVKAHMLLKASVCPLCDKPFGGMASKDIVLDHSHRTGHIRGILCRNCNGMEGQIFNRAARAKRSLTELAWLKNLVAYLEKHTPPITNYLHPTFKDDDQKRVRRNKLARARRAKKK